MQRCSRDKIFNICKLYGMILLLLALTVFGVTACGKTENAASESTSEIIPEMNLFFFGCSDDSDAILLQADGYNVLIDTGLAADSRRLVDSMKNQGVKELDLMILTHPDKDHIGGAEAVLRNFEVKEIVQSNCVKENEEYESWMKTIKEREILVPNEELKRTYGEMELTIYPPKEAVYDIPNNYSIAVLASYQGKHIFMPGDAEKKRVKELLDEELPKVDIYKVTYHGRRVGKSKELVKMLQPQYAVVTAQAPDEKVQKELDKVGAVVYSSYRRTVHFVIRQGAILDEQEVK